MLMNDAHQNDYVLRIQPIDSRLTFEYTHRFLGTFRPIDELNNWNSEYGSGAYCCQLFMCRLGIIQSCIFGWTCNYSLNY